MAKVFLESTDSNYKVVNDGVKVFGASESQAVELDASVKNIIVDANVEQVNLSGNLTEYKLSQEGTNLVVKKGSDIIATIGTNELASKLKFANTGDNALNIEKYNDTNLMKIVLPSLSGALSAADKIKALDDANEIILDLSNTTAISGTTVDVKALVDSANAQTPGLILKNDVAITLSDTGAVAAADIKAIDAATTGLVDASSVTSITGAAADVKAVTDNKGDSGDKVKLKSDVAITLSDTTATAADLKAIEAATTGLVDASSVTSITGAVADVKALVDKKGTTGDAVNLKDDVAITLSDTTAAAADIKAIDAATTGLVDASSVTSITGAVADVKAVTDNKGDSGDKVKLKSDVAITLSDTGTVADIKAIDDAAGNVTITNTVEIDGTADGNSTADTIDVSGITFTSGEVTIDGKDGDDKIIGGTEADTIKGGDGNDIIRGGAGADTIDGGDGDDVFVVLGTIGADDYAEVDIANTTGAYALGLANTIDAGVTTSDSGTDGTGETYTGGNGNDKIEVWGEADLTNATISEVETIDTHSTLNIKDTQLKSLFIGNGSAVNLNLLDDDSTINIIGSGTASGHEIISTDIGLSILMYFKTGIDQNSAADTNFNPTISFYMDPLDKGTAINYKIQKEDIIPTADDSGNWTYTDNADENSVIAVVDNTTSGATTTINAGNGMDIVVMDIGAMDNSVTVDGGNDMDILVYFDTNGATDDLDNVTNTEVVYFLDGVSYGGSTISGASVTTVDSLVASGETLIVAAEDLKAGGLTWDGSAETDGKFNIYGSEQADTITGGAGNDTITGGAGNDTITGGAGSDTFVFSAKANNGEDTIKDFTAKDADGNVVDKLNVKDVDTLNGDGVAIVSSSDPSTKISAKKVFVVTDNAQSDWSDVTTKIGSALDESGTSADDKAIIVIDNGTNAHVYEYANDGTDNARPLHTLCKS